MVGFRCLRSYVLVINNSFFHCQFCIGTAAACFSSYFQGGGDFPFSLTIEVQGSCRAELARAMLSRSLQSLCIFKCTAKIQKIFETTKFSPPLACKNLLRKRGKLHLFSSRFACRILPGKLHSPTLSALVDDDNVSVLT
jgi:hypothetical protein